MSDNTSTSERQIDYAPDWDEDQRRGYRAYKRAKDEGKSEREALNLAFKHAQKDMPEYGANVDEKAGREKSDLMRMVSGTGDENKGYKIFDMDYFDIALDDMPGEGKLIICKDPQNRIKEGNWAVVKQNDERGEKPPTAIALFWELAEAEKFAQKY